MAELGDTLHAIKQTTTADLSLDDGSKSRWKRNRGEMNTGAVWAQHDGQLQTNKATVVMYVPVHMQKSYI